MSRDRRPLGAPSDVHDVREDRLLRLVAEQARLEARARRQPPHPPLSRAGRGLELVRDRRSDVRRPSLGTFSSLSDTVCDARRRTSIANGVRRRSKRYSASARSGGGASGAAETPIASGGAGGASVMSTSSSLLRATTIVQPGSSGRPGTVTADGAPLDRWDA